MTKLDKIMDGYYDALTKHKINLDNVYNALVDIWSKSKKEKKIILATEKDYEQGYPVIYAGDKFYVVELDLFKDEVRINLRNFQTDMFIADEICWYGNHELKTLVIDKVAEHLGYKDGFEENNNKQHGKK